MRTLDWQRDMAIELFLKRAQSPPPQIDNSKLYAGEPMFYYCEHCGWPCDIKPEEWVYPPNRQCSECGGLERNGLLSDALRALKQAKGNDGLSSS